jgi:hypothetical protein
MYRNSADADWVSGMGSTGGFTTGPRPGLHAVDGEPDQVPRLIEFRKRHPEVEIVLAGLWRAVIPLENGEQIVCRYELRDLLDKLGELLG